MTKHDDAAFPTKILGGHYEGLTKREYAAIHLKVPNSGDEVIDAMIRESLRDDMARAIMKSICEDWHPENAAPMAYKYAKAMMEARND